MYAAAAEEEEVEDFKVEVIVDVEESLRVEVVVDVEEGLRVEVVVDVEEGLRVKVVVDVEEGLRVEVVDVEGLRVEVEDFVDVERGFDVGDTELVLLLTDEVDVLVTALTGAEEVDEGLVVD